MTVTAVITLSAQKGHRDELLQTVQEPIRLTRENTQCLSVRVVLDTENIEQLIFIEDWTSEQAHNDHLQQLMDAGHMVPVLPLLSAEITTVHYQSLVN